MYRQAPPEPQAGWFALRAIECKPYYEDYQQKHCWLMNNFKPTGHFKTSILLFHISKEEAEALKAKNAGMKQPVKNLFLTPSN
jgi:hypothetical protein